MGLFQELKRRNVFRVAAAYLVVAWLLLQLVDVVAPILLLPDWVARAVLLLLVIGLPIALVFAWAFELTPDGLRHESEVDRTQSITRATGRKLNLLIIGVLALAVVLLLVDRFVLRPGAPDGSPGASADAPSIAVLPFANMSSDDENEHFCDGLSEELLNHLAKIDDLKVAGRTSSFHFKGQNPDLREVGRLLGVEHILEGSVRKSGNDIRITAQLIKADDGFHLWSETYDRTLDDIFEIQDEIAASVARELRATLLGAEQSATRQQAEIPPEVYARYIAARARIHQSDGLDTAFRMLEGVIEDAPEFGPGYAALAIAAVQRGRLTSGMTPEEARQIARNATERALELAPDDDFVRTAHGVYLSELVENANADGMRRVNREFRRALEINPDNVEAMYYLAFNLRWMEEYSEAIELLERALRIDPVDESSRWLMTWALAEANQVDRAVNMAVESVELFPEATYFFIHAAQAEISRGRPERAIAWLRRMQEAGGRLGEIGARVMLASAGSLRYQPGIDEALGQLREWDRGRDLADVEELTLQARWRDGLDKIRALIEQDGWATWEAQHFYLAAHAGECDMAFESGFASRLWREWSEGDTPVDATNDSRALWGAWCLQEDGMHEQAESLLRAYLDYAAPHDDRTDEPGLRWSRIKAYAMLGQREAAIGEFQAYHDAGMGVLPPYPPESDPRMASIAGDPEFREIYVDIVALNQRRLERMITNDFEISPGLE